MLLNLRVLRYESSREAFAMTITDETGALDGLPSELAHEQWAFDLALLHECVRGECVCRSLERLRCYLEPLPDELWSSDSCAWQGYDYEDSCELTCIDGMHYEQFYDDPYPIRVGSHAPVECRHQISSQPCPYDCEVWAEL